MFSVWSLEAIKQLQTIKLLVIDVFNNAQIGQCVAEVLKKEFKGTNEILMDLNAYKYSGKAIKSISQKLTENKHCKFQSEWNKYDEIILYQLLLKVLKHKLLSELDSNNSIKQMIYSFHEYIDTQNDHNLERKAICAYGFFRQSLQLNKPFCCQCQWIPQVIVFICCDYIDLFPDFITILTNVMFDEFAFKSKCELIIKHLGKNWILSSENMFIRELNIGFDIALNLGSKIYKNVAGNTAFNMSIYPPLNERNKIFKLVLDNLKYYQNEERLHFMSKLQEKCINDRVLFGTYYSNNKLITDLVRKVLSLHDDDKSSFIAYKMSYFMDICNDFYDLDDKDLFIVFQSSMLNYVTAIQLSNAWRGFIKQNNIDSTYLLTLHKDDTILRRHWLTERQIQKLMELIIVGIKKSVKKNDDQHSVLAKLPKVIFSTCFLQCNQFCNTGKNKETFIQSIEEINSDQIEKITNGQLQRGNYVSDAYDYKLWTMRDTLMLNMKQCIALCRVQSGNHKQEMGKAIQNVELYTYDDYEEWHGGICGISAVSSKTSTISELSQ